MDKIDNYLLPRWQNNFGKTSCKHVTKIFQTVEGDLWKSGLLTRFIRIIIVKV